MPSNPYQSPEKLSEGRAGNWQVGRTNSLVVKKIGVLSAAQMLGCLYAALGLIVGGFFSIFALAGAAAGGGEGLPAMLFGVLSVIVIPIIYGVMGFIGGIIMAVLYNLIATVAGGIELQVTT